MKKQPPFECWPENWPILTAFFALDDCAWQYSSMGQIIGLNYQAAAIIWSGLGIELSHDQFSGVMLFARTVTREHNKKFSKNG